MSVKDIFLSDILANVKSRGIAITDILDVEVGKSLDEIEPIVVSPMLPKSSRWWRFVTWLYYRVAKADRRFLYGFYSHRIVLNGREYLLIDYLYALTLKDISTDKEVRERFVKSMIEEIMNREIEVNGKKVKFIEYIKQEAEKKYMEVVKLGQKPLISKEEYVKKTITSIKEELILTINSDLDALAKAMKINNPLEVAKTLRTMGRVPVGVKTGMDGRPRYEFRGLSWLSAITFPLLEASLLSIHAKMLAAKPLTHGSSHEIKEVVNPRHMLLPYKMAIGFSSFSELPKDIREKIVRGEISVDKAISMLPTIMVIRGYRERRLPAIIRKPPLLTDPTYTALEKTRIQLEELVKKHNLDTTINKLLLDYIEKKLPENIWNEVSDILNKNRIDERTLSLLTLYVVAKQQEEKHVESVKAITEYIKTKQLVILSADKTLEKSKRKQDEEGYEVKQFTVQEIPQDELRSEIDAYKHMDTLRHVIKDLEEYTLKIENPLVKAEVPRIPLPPKEDRKPVKKKLKIEEIP